MHILEVYIECGGYDYKLIKGGISVYIWNLAREMAACGEKVSILTALHGQKDYLTSQHGMKELDYSHNWRMEIDADPAIWNNEKPIELPLKTKAYLIEKQGIDIYLLSNEYLDMYPDTCYPPYESKGKDLGFFKPLVFQAEAISFIRQWFDQQKLTIQAHEPYYQYLIPAAFQNDPLKKVISNVQSNMPINKKVYGPKVASLFQQLNISVELDKFRGQLADSDFNRCLMDYMPRTHLNYPYTDDYINLFALVLEYSDLIDFLSEGHLEFYSQFRGTAFKALYDQLAISQTMQKHQDKFFVGGCAISQSWLTKDFSHFDRTSILISLGLDPALPTFFHNARYAPNHKGQNELIQAVENILQQGGECNFILRCVSGTPLEDPRFQQLADRYPHKVIFEWKMISEEALMALAAASDFALFPSKFEMDTFLIAIGEAMLAGCIPIASQQLGMKHWGHSPEFSKGLEEPTGFSVIRSFLEDDPLLVQSITQAITAALGLYAQPETYQKKSQFARLHAQKFNWQETASRHLSAFKNHTPRVTDDFTEHKNWRAAALNDGHLISYRQQAATQDLPVLKVGAIIEYHLLQATSVMAFIPEAQTFKEIILDKTDGFFRAALPENIEQVFLLITLEDGNQYWDGLIKGEMDRE